MSLACMSKAQVLLALWPTQLPKENPVSREDVSSLIFVVNLYASLKTQLKCHLLWKVFPSKLLGIP